MKVIEALSGVELGYVVNISETGMQVDGEYPLDTNTDRVFALEIILPQENEDNALLSISARNLWLKREPTPVMFATGFHITGMDQLGSKRWRSLVQQYTTAVP